MTNDRFEVQERPEQAPVLTATQSAREAQEVQAMMVVAKKFPRDVVKARERILLACARPKLAEQALYQYARGGTDIQGPSIRLAEAMAQSWGNLQFGIRELEQRDGESSVEAFCWDTETNVRQVKVFAVPHIRHTKKGSYKLEDPRDIYEMVANQGARRMRACILGIIPGDITEEAVAECDKTLAATAKVTPERIKSMVTMFGEFGVTRTQIEARIQRRVDTVTPALLIQLAKIYQSLKDGMSAPADWFEAEQQAEGQEQPAPAAKKKGGTAALKDKLADHKVNVRLGVTSMNDSGSVRVSVDDTQPGVPKDVPEVHADGYPEVSGPQDSLFPGDPSGPTDDEGRPLKQ